MHRNLAGSATVVCTTGDIVALLEQAINDALALEDSLQRARTGSYLALGALKVFELTQSTKATNMDDRKLFDKATVTWYQHCERKGYLPTQPSVSTSASDQINVYLRNTKGDLIVYNTASGQIIEPDEQAKHVTR